MLMLYSVVNATPHSRGDLSHPIAVTAPANIGQVSVQKLYLHNSNSLVYYTDVSLQVPSYLIPEDISVKLLFQPAVPTTAQWDAINSGNVISIPHIGTVNGCDLRYQALWLRIEVGKATPVGTYAGLKVKVTAIEHAL